MGKLRLGWHGGVERPVETKVIFPASPRCIKAITKRSRGFSGSVRLLESLARRHLPPQFVVDNSQQCFFS
jgi:hypothetical protein